MRDRSSGGAGRAVKLLWPLLAALPFAAALLWAFSRWGDTVRDLIRVLTGMVVKG